MKCIITHKQFDLPLEQNEKEKYTVLCPKDVATIENWPNVIYFESKLDNRVWSEISAMDWIYRNVDSERIEINHYRRLLDSLYNQNNVASPMIFPLNIAQHYQNAHNIQDLAIVSNIIKENYPQYYNDWLSTIQSNVFYPYNMCNLSIKTYREYMSIMMTILYKYTEIVKCFTYDEFLNKIKTDSSYSQMNCEGKNITPEYQARIPAFLSERISTWFYNLLVKRGEIIFPCEIKRFDGAF